ncbi:hypothetical protein EP331_08225 [bacterium]|nr:MAG: hypothetical protein EP331_08225 [bacterium]
MRRNYFILIFCIVTFTAQAQTFHNSPNEWALNYGLIPTSTDNSYMIGFSYLKQGMLDVYNQPNVFLGGDFNYVHHPITSFNKSWYLQTNIYGGPGVIINSFGPRFHPYAAFMVGFNLDIIHDPGRQFNQDEDPFWEAYDIYKARILYQTSVGININLGELDTQQHSMFTFSLRYNYSNMIYHHISLGWVYRIM